MRAQLNDRETPWPVLRNLTTTVLDLQRPHTFLGQTTANVGHTLSRLAHCQQITRRAQSLHASLIDCMARAAVEHPAVLTYRHRRRLITFDSAHVRTALNKRLPDGSRLPVVTILREANSRSADQIQHEFRLATRSDLTDDPALRARRRLASWPGWLRKWVLRRALANPFRLRELYGNIQITSLQQSGTPTPLWAFPANFGTVAFAAGAVSRGFVPGPTGQPVLTQLLPLAGAMDHDVLDGMAAVGLTRRFVELIETAAGLDDNDVDQTLALSRERSR